MYEVIIVEDDPMVAMINKQYVNQDPHFRVSAVCRDGASALEYMTENVVHLAIIDKYMPRMDGIELLHRMRRMNLPVSVIMVTAANDSPTIEEALRLGIVDYLVKPFDNARFRRALEGFLNRENAFRDLSSFSQQSIDSLLNSSSNRADKKYELPKGIQDSTLDTICLFLQKNADTEFTSEDIADKVGLSRVTVRRYMNFLMEKGRIEGHMNYGTGGRPSMLYRWNKQDFGDNSGIDRREEQL